MRTLSKPRPVEWLYLAGGLVLLLRYLWFMDDAFVYFRYVDNLLFLRIGLVYNHGEYVEGFSSPIWVGVLSLLRAVHLNYLAIIRSIAVASFVLFWYMLVQLNRRMSPEGPVINFPLVYLGFTYGVLSYFSSGVETPLVQVAAIMYALFILHPSSRPLQIVVALSPLLRHELILPLAICGIWYWGLGRRFPLAMLIAFLASFGSWMAFRIYYYADLFPNPFYLKDTVYLSQGLVYLHNTLSTYKAYVVAAIFLVLGFLLRKRGIDFAVNRRLVMLIAALPVVIYVVKIGGDARHYRYLAFPFCLATCALGGMLEHAYAAFGQSRRRWLLPVAGPVLAVVTALAFPHQLDKHPIYSDVDGRVIDGISDAAGHRTKPASQYSYWGSKVTIGDLRSYRNQHPEFEYTEVGANGWCHLNYLHYNRRIVHTLGLTEPVLGRVQMESHRPAHKHRLRPMAKEIVEICLSGDHVGRGMYRAAVERGIAPPWVQQNLQTIEVIESKAFNRHDFIENLKLAFTFTARIHP